MNKMLLSFLKLFSRCVLVFHHQQLIHRMYCNCLVIVKFIPRYIVSSSSQDFTDYSRVFLNLYLFTQCQFDLFQMSLEDDNWVLKDELPYSVEALSEITLDTRTKALHLLFSVALLLALVNVKKHFASQYNLLYFPRLSFVWSLVNVKKYFYLRLKNTAISSCEC